MKKSLLLLLSVFLLLSASAQFKLTPEGFVDCHNDQNNYLLLDFEGVGNESVFRLTLDYLYSIPGFEKMPVTIVDGVAVFFSYAAAEEVYIDKMFRWEIKYNIEYSLALVFEQGSMRVSAPVVYNFTHNDTIGWGLKTYAHPFLKHTQNIYGYRGKLLYPKMKESLENYFNGFITDLYLYIMERRDDEELSL